MEDSYAGLSGYYDLVMTSGYYDHDAYAKSMVALLGHRRNLLEVGVGTGLVCEKLMRLSENDLRIIGIDPSDSMLAQARQRLGGRVRLQHQDVLRLALPRAVDVAYSVGGVWAYVRDQHDVRLASLLDTDDENLRALEKLRRHVNSGGLLLLAVQQPQVDHHLRLSNGMSYRQEVREEAPGRLVKYYWVADGEVVMAHQRARIRMFGEDQAENLMARSGFRFDRTSPDDMFFVFTRS